MKRAGGFIFTTVCILVMSSCGSQVTVPEASNSTSNPIQKIETSNPNEGKDWSEQDITSMFCRAQETDWEYIDCVLIPDYASDRIGAVLFWDDEKKTSNVAFFDADGYYQQCGIYAKMSAQPDFAYLGNGAVEFKLETDDGTIYNSTLTISIDGSDVHFIFKDDLLK